MDETQNGYTFFESEAYPEGYDRLDVRLTDAPRGRYFDAVQITLPVVLGPGSGAGHGLTPERVEHPWRGPAAARVGPGRVRLLSHRGEVDDAFTFGGNITFEVNESETICRLQSTAPIYHHGDDQHITSFNLVDELEALFALRQGHYAAHAAEYQARLAKADPKLLFYASLLALDGRLRSSRNLSGDPTLHSVIDLISRTKAHLRLSGEWPEDPPRLEDIL